MIMIDMSPCRFDLCGMSHMKPIYCYRNWNLSLYVDSGISQFSFVRMWRLRGVPLKLTIHRIIFLAMEVAQNI